MQPEIISTLKEKKIRITKAREALLSIFSNSNNPESVQHILSKLAKKKIYVNKTTVYRELSFLIKQSLIKEVYTDPVRIHYESSNLKHHHHLICTNCGRIEDFEMKDEMKKTEEVIMRSKKFKVSDHSLEFYGFCANCRQS
jgi:Fe2+ or Zn2+ uptake regulation protein